MLLDIERSGEYDKEHSKEWLLNSDPGNRIVHRHAQNPAMAKPFDLGSPDCTD